MAREDRPNEAAGHESDDDHAPPFGGTEAQTELDLTRIERDDPSQHAELKIRLWLVGTVHLRSSSATLVAVLGLAITAGLVGYSVSEGADLLPVGLLALAILIATVIIMKLMRVQPLRSRRLRRRSRRGK